MHPSNEASWPWRPQLLIYLFNYLATIFTCSTIIIFIIIIIIIIIILEEKDTH